jgi:hypothetical protein
MLQPDIGASPAATAAATTTTATTEAAASAAMEASASAAAETGVSTLRGHAGAAAGLDVVERIAAAAAR